MDTRCKMPDAKCRMLQVAWDNPDFEDAFKIESSTPKLDSPLHDSQFTIHYSLLTTHYSLLTT